MKRTAANVSRILSTRLNYPKANFANTGTRGFYVQTEATALVVRFAQGAIRDTEQVKHARLRAIYAQLCVPFPDAELCLDDQCVRIPLAQA